MCQEYSEQMPLPNTHINTHTHTDFIEACCALLIIEPKCAYIYIYIHIYTYIHICTYIYTHIDIYIYRLTMDIQPTTPTNIMCTHTDTHTHAHTQRQRQRQRERERETERDTCCAISQAELIAIAHSTYTLLLHCPKKEKIIRVSHMNTNINASRMHLNIRAQTLTEFRSNQVAHSTARRNNMYKPNCTQ